MSSEFEISKTLGGWALTLYGDKTKGKIEAIKENEFSYLVLKDNKNNDLSWLSVCKDKIRSLIVVDVTPASLESLNRLEKLVIHHARGPYPIFPSLRSLTLMTSKAWHPSINQFEQLEFLEAHGWPEQNLSAISNLNNLKLLSLVDSRKLENLDGIRFLNTLYLVACSKLVDCSNIATVQGLQGLYIKSCKAIQDFGFLNNLKSVVELYLDIPKIPSLALLGNLPNLKSLGFANTIIEDGDVASQLNFTELRLSMFRNKRSYNQTMEGVQEALTRKWNLPPSPFSKPRETIIGYCQPRFALDP